MLDFHREVLATILRVSRRYRAIMSEAFKLALVIDPIELDIIKLFFTVVLP